MQGINRNRVIVVIMVWVISMMLFRVDDPYKLQLLLLVFCLPFVKITSIMNFSWIDVCVLVIWLLDVVLCIRSNCTTRSVGLSYNTTIGVILYILARNILLEEACKKLFLKILCLSIAIALCISTFSFILYEQVMSSVQFYDTYPFRYLFNPLGYITNVWSTILFSLLGILSISYHILREKVWKRITVLLLGVCVTNILLSFSRGAYIALGLYVTVCLLFISSYTRKIKIVICCLLLGGTIYFLFPEEVGTTIRMNQTTLQQQSDEGRLNGTQAALNVCKSNIVFGAGLGNYTLAIDHELNQDSLQKYTSYAPNIVLHLLLEKGFVGVLVYMFLLICIFIRLWKQRKDYINVIIGAAFLAICVKELTISVVLVSPFALCICYILLALLQKNNVVIVESSSISIRAKYSLIVWGTMCFIAYESFSVLYNYNERCNKESIDDLKKKKYSEAIRSIERTSEWTPYLINRVKLYMDCYEKQLLPQYLTQAELALFKVQKRNPDDIYLDYLHARLLILKRDYVNAHVILKKMVDCYPQNVLYNFALCKFLSDMGQRNDALPYLKKVLLINPRLLNMQTIERLKEVDISLYCDLVFWLKKQENMKSDPPEIMARKGYVAFYLGEYERSKKCLMRALLQQPNFSIPWLLLGKISEREGEFEKSRLYFKRYNILMKGVFSLSSYDITDLDLFSEEQKYLEVHYASKFRDWYGSQFMY